MKLLTISVALLWVLSCQAQGQNSDLKRLSLHGNVKSIRERAYQPKFRDGNVQNGDPEFSSYAAFNESGNKMEDTNYSPDGKVDKKHRCLYDSAGNRTVQDQYDADEKLLGKITYAYDRKGRLREDRSFSAGGKPGNRFTYSYNTKGEIIADSSFNGENKFQNKCTYTYDRAGNKTVTRKYSAQGKLEKTLRYSYDQFGNVLVETVESPDGSKTTYGYEYEFDMQGNWIRKVTFMDQKPTSVLEREIVYN